jgi:hypothetical protein
VQGKKKMAVGGPRGINTPRSRIVTAIFQSSEPPRKISELPTFEISADLARTVGTSEKKLRTSEQQTAGAKQQQVSSLWVRIRV